MTFDGTFPLQMDFSLAQAGKRNKKINSNERNKLWLQSNQTF